MKSLVDSWFDELSDRIETKTNLYVDIKPFFKRSKVNENELEGMLEPNDV